MSTLSFVLIGYVINEISFKNLNLNNEYEILDFNDIGDIIEHGQIAIGVMLAKNDNDEFVDNNQNEDFNYYLKEIEKLTKILKIDKNKLRMITGTLYYY